MRRSTDRILTTHVGSLARPPGAAGHDEGAGERPALRPRPVRPPGHRGRGRAGPPAGRGRHRHRHRRRDEQGELPRLREGSPGRLRGRHGRVADGAVVAEGVRRLPRVLHRVLQEVLVDGQPAAPHHLQGPDQLRRPGAAADRHRQPEGGHRAVRRGRRVHALDRAERVRAQRALRHPRGVPPRRGRGHARGVPRHRGRRLHPAGRRPVPDRSAERSHAGARGAPTPGVGPRRGAQPRAARHPEPRASATTPATASTTGRG